MVNSALVIKGLLKEKVYLLLLPESKGGGSQFTPTALVPTELKASRKDKF